MVDMLELVSTPTTTIDLSDYIEARLFDERPHIKNRRLPISFIVNNAYKNGWSVPYLAYAFHVSEIEVLAALLYYAEHKERVDELEAAERAELDRLYELHNKPK